MKWERKAKLKKKCSSFLVNLFLGWTKGLVTWPPGTRRREESKIYDTGCANTVKLPRIRSGDNFCRRTPGVFSFFVRFCNR